MSKNSAIVAIIIALVGGIMVGRLTVGMTSGENSEAAVSSDNAGEMPAGNGSDTERFRIPVTAQQPSKGPADALVTIVEFSDFQCPFCSRVGPTISRIMNEYQGKVRVVWRNQPLPMHRDAKPAAAAAMEAFRQGGSTKFWAMHDLLFQHQRELSRDKLESYAQQLGLDMTKFRRALDGNEHDRAIDADQQLARQVGATGTPHFFVNGKRLSGAQPYEEFKRVIDEEIRNAERLLRSGTPKNQLYTTIVRNGQTSAAAGNNNREANNQARRQPNPNTVYKVPVQGNEPSRGPADALVTIVEFSDFECPFCGRVEPTMKQIAEQYGNDVRIVWMNNPLPFHRNATPAAMASLEAMQQGGSAKFWAMHAKLFENQRALTRENLESYAQAIGLNMAQFRQALDTNEHQAAIEAQKTLARSLGASGTPAFFINGRNLRGAQPLEAFKAVIDEELRKARERVARGTPKSRLYQEIIANGATSQQFIGGDQAPSGQPGARGEQAAAEAPDANRVYNISVPSNAPSKGPANAPVTIQLFSDFQCPFCSRINPTLEQVAREYGNQVRIVWRDYPLPFHPNAMPAAEAAREVFRQGGATKFWQYHALLFQNQRELTREKLEQLATQLGGINITQFRQALDNHTHQAAVQADVNAVRAAGAQIGTPSAFINGRLLQGAVPFEQFKAAIDRELQSARSRNRR